MSERPRVWLGSLNAQSRCDTDTQFSTVIGASSGFGRATAETALRMNEKVVGVCRHPEDLNDLAKANPESFIAVKCDVTKQEDVLAAFASAIEKFWRVDVVLNSAGTAMLAELEASPDDAARALFDVNFWGALTVSREAVRVFRDVNPGGVGGRLLNITSGVGFSGMPLCGIYAASKHAVEGFTESLAREVDPAWNIKISIIGPGGFKTGMHNDRTLNFPAPPAYDKHGLPSRLVRQWFEDGSGIRGDPVAAAEAFFKFSLLDAPPMRWAVGKDAIDSARTKIKTVAEETDAYESWSEGLEL
ncbi:NAD(P)-binding protein [Mycena amicta]|nr:NAD(P)-binding protein [Mycena amicta]